MSAHSVCPCTQLTRRSAIILPCLHYYARFTRYKSCCPHQKRQSERVVFFHATADFKQNYVLSANGTAFVCPCTLCSWRNALQVNLPAYAIRSLRSPQVLLSAPKKDNPKGGCLFSCGSGLETKLRFVGKRHCVCLPLHVADMANEGMYRLKD